MLLNRERTSRWKWVCSVLQDKMWSFVRRKYFCQVSVLICFIFKREPSIIRYHPRKRIQMFRKKFIKYCVVISYFHCILPYKVELNHVSDMCCYLRTLARRLRQMFWSLHNFLWSQQPLSTFLVYVFFKFLLCRAMQFGYLSFICYGN